MGKLRPEVGWAPKVKRLLGRRGVQIVELGCGPRARVASRAQARGSELGCRSAVAEDRGRGAGGASAQARRAGGDALGARAGQPAPQLGLPRPGARRPPARPAPRPARGAPAAWRWDGGAPRGRGGGGGGGGAGESGGAERAAGPGGRRGLRACDEEFACPELEALFRGYTLRLEQAATLKALAVLSLLAGALALAELLGAPGPAPGLAKGLHPVHCVLFLALLVVTNVRARCRCPSCSRSASSPCSSASPSPAVLSRARRPRGCPRRGGSGAGDSRSGSLAAPFGHLVS